VLSALRIKDQNLEENSKTYLTMFLIDHCRTSKDHPQVDGLAKRMVQMHKKGFWKICFTRNEEDWDLAFLPYIAVGYKMSKHISLFHFSPYFLLFGKHPIPPYSIIVQMD
jgi:hypothetical protein